MSLQSRDRGHEADFTAVAPASVPSDRREPGEELILAFEEFTSVGSVGPIGRWDLRLIVAITCLAGITALGFIGRLGTDGGASGEHARPKAEGIQPARSNEPDPAIGSLVVTSPAEGQRIVGGIVTVRATAQAAGRVHADVVLGDAVLGWSNIGVARPGAFEMAIRVFAPSFEAPVVVRLSEQSAGSSPPLTSQRRFVLSAHTFTGLWSARLIGSGPSSVIVVDGSGPFEGGPQAIIVGTSVSNDPPEMVKFDRVLATAEVVFRREDFRAGSDGGSRIGLGSFHLVLNDLGPIPDGRLVVQMTARDADNVHGGSVVGIEVTRTYQAGLLSNSTARGR